MVLLTLTLLVSPCDSLAPTGPVRAVQQSSAFVTVIRTLPDTLHGQVQGLCNDLQAGPNPLPGGATFVSALAAPGFVPIYATFAVRGDSVWLLNPVRNGFLAGSLDVAAWNSAVGGRFPITNDSVAKWYARGVAALHMNWGPAPYPFCGRDSLVVSRPSPSEYVVEDWMLLRIIRFRAEGTVVTIDEPRCP